MIRKLFQPPGNQESQGESGAMVILISSSTASSLYERVERPTTPDLKGYSIPTTRKVKCENGHQNQCVFPQDCQLNKL